jgi:putative restriction endonuclease
MRVISTYDVAMVDACHIVPVGRHGSDHVTNGLSLCPNLHRAFDRGLISVDDNYRVLVSDSFGEVEGHPYSLRSLAGKPLALPFDRKYYPERRIWRGTGKRCLRNDYSVSNKCSKNVFIQFNY